MNIEKSTWDEQSAYNLLQYYFAKLETKNTQDEIYTFLLEFIRSSVGKHQFNSPACIYLINQSDMSLYVSNFAPETIPATFFEGKLEDLVTNGLTAWCIRNRRMTFSPHSDKEQDMYLLLPLYTKDHTLGLILAYTDTLETELPQEIIQVITIACMQTAIYAENTRIYSELQDTHLRMIHTERLSAIGQMAASIAHEINTPVGYVKGNSELLINYIANIKKVLLHYQLVCVDPEIETLKKQLDIDFIIEEVDNLTIANIRGLQRITDIVANIKNFAHQEQKEQFKLSDIEENIQTTLKVANSELKDTAEVITRFSNVSQVMCITEQLNQVFLNLIINAAQAVREVAASKKGIITIETKEDPSSIYIIISDNGPGMEQHELSKIFKPFYTTKPVGKGTGLGLSITSDIIKKHSGEITVTSEKGNGTIFTIKLPKFK